MANGFPNLLHPPTTIKDATRLANQTGLLIADGVLVLNKLFSNAVWGIYLGAKLQFNPDSMKSFDYIQATKISDYPQELGAFQSYNKVGTPFEVRIELTKGGNQRERSAFLDAIEKAAASLDLYDVITPEKKYVSMNIERYNVRRTATEGAGLITVDLWFMQVRVSAETAFTNSKKPSGMAVQSDGTVQSQTPTPAVTDFVGKVPNPAVTNFVDRVPPPKGAGVIR